MFYRLALFFVPLYIRIIYRIRVTGLENIPDSGAAILCPNHIHFADPVVVASLVKRRHRKVYFMGKAELFKKRFFAWALKCFCVFPVDRTKTDTKAYKRATELLMNGNILCMFAQGQRLDTVDAKTAKTGVALFALKTHTAVIPVGICAPRNYRFFSKVCVNFGKPMILDEYYNEKIKSELLDSITEKIMNEVSILAE